MASVYWFKTNTLRLLANPLLTECHRSSAYVNHVFVLDPRSFRSIDYKLKDEDHDVNITDCSMKCSFKRFFFLCESLNCLQYSLKENGSHLDVYMGKAEDIIPAYMTSLSTFPCITCPWFHDFDTVLRVLRCHQGPKLGSRGGNRFFLPICTISAGDPPQGRKRS